MPIKKRYKVAGSNDVCTHDFNSQQQQQSFIYPRNI